MKSISNTNKRSRKQQQKFGATLDKLPRQEDKGFRVKRTPLDDTERAAIAMEAQVVRDKAPRYYGGVVSSVVVDSFTAYARQMLESLSSVYAQPAVGRQAMPAGSGLSRLAAREALIARERNALGGPVQVNIDNTGGLVPAAELARIRDRNIRAHIRDVDAVIFDVGVNDIYASGERVSREVIRNEEHRHIRFAQAYGAGPSRLSRMYEEARAQAGVGQVVYQNPFDMYPLEVTHTGRMHLDAADAIAMAFASHKKTREPKEVKKEVKSGKIKRTVFGASVDHVAKGRSARIVSSTAQSQSTKKEKDE